MTNEFNEKFNISYIDESLPTPDKKLIIKHCICSYIVYFVVYLILLLNPFFKYRIDEDLRHYYEIALGLYVVSAPVLYFLLKPKSLYYSHNIEICNYFLRIFKCIFNKDTVLKKDFLTILNTLTPAYKEKQSLMLMFIKVFFGTLMASSLYRNIDSLRYQIRVVGTMFSTLFINLDFESFRIMFINNENFLWSFSLLILFTVDVGIFAFGYLTELSLFKNKIRKVETNIMGVLFCLMCYPPFNGAITNFLGWSQKDSAILFGEDSIIGWIVRIIALCFLVIYVLASVALGTKASNLTNRGIVSKFPYNIVRHPAYMSKTMFWFLTTLPVIIVQVDIYNIGNHLLESVLVLFSYFSWFAIYYMRAITEERFLMQDPDYQEYCKKVRWRYIPHVF